jgi:hypothetical protein
MEYFTSSFPFKGCSTLGRVEFIRVPCPAARMMVERFIFLSTKDTSESFYSTPD